MLDQKLKTRPTLENWSLSLNKIVQQTEINLLGLSHRDSRDSNTNRSLSNNMSTFNMTFEDQKQDRFLNRSSNSYRNIGLNNKDNYS